MILMLVGISAVRQQQDAQDSDSDAGGFQCHETIEPGHQCCKTTVELLLSRASRRETMKLQARDKEKEYIVRRKTQSLPRIFVF